MDTVTCFFVGAFCGLILGWTAALLACGMVCKETISQILKLPLVVKVERRSDLEDADWWKPEDYEDETDWS